MINFSDIFGDDKKRKGKGKDSHHIDFSSLDNEEESSLKDGAKIPADKNIKFSDPGTKLKRVSPREKKEIEDLYRKSVSLAERVFNSEKEIKTSEIDEIKKLSEILVGYSRNGSQELFEYIFGRLPYDVDFMILNLVNVCILAIEVGVGLGYSDHELINIGIGAFLHDIGMNKYRSLFSQPRGLTPQEKKKIQNHPLDGVNQLKFIHQLLEPLALRIVEQEHERMDGSGYPYGLKADNIDEYAQIVGMVDVYEALTHKRSYRNSYSPMEAIKIILQDKTSFSPKILKAFLEKVGLYPKGTFVELNTKEIAQVINQTPKMPSCPVVGIVYDYEGKKVDTEKIIDLSKNTKIYITKSL